MRFLNVLILMMVAAPALVVQAITEWNGSIFLAREDRLLEIHPSGKIEPAKLQGITGKVVAMTTDRNGHLWIATETGLIRCKARICKPAPEAQIRGIQTLAFDSQNSLWIGTRSGLFTLKDSAVRRSPLASNMVQALTFSADGSLWLGSGFEVVRVRNGKRETFSLPPPPANVRMQPPVTSIAVTKNGEVYVGTRGGLLLLDGQTFVKKSEDEILALLEDSSGTLWAGTSDGLKKFVKGRWTDVVLP